MWLYNYFSIIVFTSLMNSKTVENNESKGEIMYSNIYIVKNLIPSQMKDKVLQIINSGPLKKPAIVDSKEKNYIKDLSGAIVILKNDDDSKLKKTNEEKEIESNNIIWINPKRIEKQKHLSKFIKDNNKIAMRNKYVVKKGSIPKRAMNPLSSNILRDKYGDSCIKLAIRKCYKALLTVKVNTCKLRYKCKSSFKSYFVKKSKQGCIKSFDFRTGSNNNTKKSSAKFRDQAFLDATREGYLDACIPYMIPHLKLQRRTILPRNMTFTNVIADFLRKRKSDEKCQKLSSVKCYRACRSAFEESCTKHSCSSRRRRDFKQACKEECTRVYQDKRSSESSKSSSSSSTSTE